MMLTVYKSGKLRGSSAFISCLRLHPLPKATRDDGLLNRAEEPIEIGGYSSAEVSIFDTPHLGKGNRGNKYYKLIKNLWIFGL